MRRRITLAAALHDIGKIELENRLLCNTDPTAEEETLLRQHTTLGAQMLEENSTRQEAAFVQTAAQICRWHHERYDGSGYPDGLVGEQIPLEAQVVGLADAYDALTGGENGRPYPHKAAVYLLCTAQSSQFSPLLLECLQEIGPELGDAMNRRQEDAL